MLQTLWERGENFTKTLEKLTKTHLTERLSWDSGLTELETQREVSEARGLGEPLGFLG